MICEYSLPCHKLPFYSTDRVVCWNWKPYALLRIWKGATPMENSMEVSQRTKNKTSHDQAVFLLGIYVKKWNKSLKHIFVLPCLLQPRDGNNPDAPQGMGRYNKCGIHMPQELEYCSAIKKKQMLLHAMTWISLEDIVLGEISQSQKDKNCMK